MLDETISHYRILERIGEGGMGVVYKAFDTRLNRPVALKVLPREKVADPERKRRFVQEARAASALNHPNIITIYDIDQAHGTDFIAMEYIAGRALDRLISGKELPPADTLRYASQIADALAAAHAAGIIHRDLKPANVMITDRGLAKVLDFGLAKLTDASQSGAAAAADAAPLTAEGTIMGTVAYMSPEQAEGAKLDARSDIFSLGSVLYEMVTGKRAFQGNNEIATLAGILHRDPRPASEVAPGVSPAVETIINRCLKKDPELRFQSMLEVRAALEQAAKAGEQAGPLPAPALPKRLVAAGLGVGVLATAALLAAAWYWLSQRQADRSEAGLLVPVHLTGYSGTEDTPSFSPDGNQVAFQWCQEGSFRNCDIYIKQIGVEPPFRLTSDPGLEFSPSWSPDGRFIALLRVLPGRDEQGVLVVVPQRGGQERLLAEADVSRANLEAASCLAWTPDSKWIAYPLWEPGQSSTRLFLISLENAEKKQLTNAEAGAHDTAPAFSPDGRALAFTREHGARSEICLLRLAPGYVPQGNPESVALGQTPNPGAAWSQDGLDLIFSSGPWSRSGLWRAAAGNPAKARRLPLASDNAMAPAISPKGDRLAYMTQRWECNIWIADLREPDAPAKLISSSGLESCPDFSADGMKIAFVSDQSGEDEVWVCNRDGSGRERLTSFGGPMVLGPRWSPDGRFIALSAQPAGNEDIYLVEARGGTPRRLTTHEASDSSPSWSADGKSLYFTSGRTGALEIWRMPSGGGEAVQVTSGGGERDRAAESHDGKSLYYQKRAGSRCSIWRMPLVAGGEALLLESVSCEGGWVLGNDGIYFLSPLDAQGRHDLLLHEFATRRIGRILTTPREVARHLALAPDGRAILYPQWDEGGSDLMLVERFR